MMHTPLTLTSGIVALACLVFLCSCLLHGLANTLDYLALKIHRAASSLRGMQRRRSNQMEETWIREIERQGQDGDMKEMGISALDKYSKS